MRWLDALPRCGCPAQARCVKPISTPGGQGAGAGWHSCGGNQRWAAGRLSAHLPLLSLGGRAVPLYSHQLVLGERGAGGAAPWRPPPRDSSAAVLWRAQLPSRACLTSLPHHQSLPVRFQPPRARVCRTSLPQMAQALSFAVAARPICGARAQASREAAASAVDEAALKRAGAAPPVGRPRCCRRSNPLLIGQAGGRDQLFPSARCWQAPPGRWPPCRRRCPTLAHPPAPD